MSHADIPSRCPGCMEPTDGTPICPHCGWMQGEQNADYPLALQPGSLLANRYVVGKVLGQGGFGITYIGWDLVLSRKKAIKECFPQGLAGRHAGSAEVFASSSSVRDALQHDVSAFLNEARLLANFENHPNIVWIQDFFAANGTAYMIIEYLHGRNLEQYVTDSGGRIPWPEAGRILISVLDALREVHRIGILHRDVSPDNVFLVRNGQIKLIDFGAARAAAGATTSGLSVILKHGYGPLEQYQQKGDQGPWTDVYAAAGTIYRAITGQTPPPAPERYLSECLRSPSSLGVAIPAHHEQALLKALAIRVEQRFPDVRSFQNALLETPPGTVSPPRQVPPPPRVNPSPASRTTEQPSRQASPAPDPVPILRPEPRPLPAPVPAPRIPWILIAGIAGTLVVAVLVTLATIRVLRGNPPEIQTFEASAASVVKGRPVTLHWSVNGATEVEIVGIGKQSPAGSLEVKPQETGTFKLQARASDGTQSEREIPIEVVPPVVPRVVRFGVSPEEVDRGSKATLSWEVADASDVKINNVAVKANGELSFTAAEDLIFRLRAISTDGEAAVGEARLRVRDGSRNPPGPAGAPRVERFGFTKASVAPGESTILVWEVKDATSVRLSGINTIDAVKPSGQLNVKFQRSGTVTLVATNLAGRTTRSASVTVQTTAQNSGPKILSFTVYPPAVDAGLNCQLRWSTQGAAYVTIAGITERLNAQGSRVVAPQRSGNIVLSAVGSDGQTVTASVSVQVRTRNGMQRQEEQAQRWSVNHDLGGPMNFGSRNWNYQPGILTLSNGRLRFEARNAADNFDVAASDIAEVSRNMLPIHGQPAFHVTLRSGRNYNFVPQGDVNRIVNAIRNGTP